MRMYRVEGIAVIKYCSCCNGHKERYCKRVTEITEDEAKATAILFVSEDYWFADKVDIITCDVTSQSDI